MHRLAFAVSLFVASTTAWGEDLAQEPRAPQWPSQVTVIKVAPGQRVHVPSVVGRGVKPHELPMASCIPRSQENQFRGDLKLFATTLPAHANLVVTVTPDKSSRRVSVFAYAIDRNRLDLPDARASARTCKWATRTSSVDRKHPTEVRLKGRDVEESVVIGVSGPGEMTDAPFTLSLDLTSP